MKAIAFNGSPRKGGNTEILLKKVLEPIAAAGIETELIQVGGTDIRGCRACYACVKNQNGRCSNDSDPLNEWLQKMYDAQAIVFGSPTYFADVSTEMKALIDRAGFVAKANGCLFARKIGAGVVVSRRGGATHVLDSINHMFLISRMIIPGSTYWNFGLARDKGEVENDQEALANMKDLGETIAWLMQATAGK
jgi:multimeric flavodoxin WrbA